MYRNTPLKDKFATVTVVLFYQNLGPTFPKMTGFVSKILSMFADKDTSTLVYEVDCNVHKYMNKQRRTQLGKFHQLLQELHLDDGRFQRYFRLSWSQFDVLLSCVGGRISLQDTNYRYFATGDSFRTIASSFHVGVSTVCKVFPDVVTAIWDCLVEEFMAVPWSIVEGFEER
ncbi:nuclease HARBI1 [Labeo rohita]|uniref:Nuclease HARBI1 n=1 Tax=Labeo rohita TaxID=84645 RepID=A0A498MC92_LABRO|nr:nuclease HARBI1 [Labeo rohita]